MKHLWEIDHPYYCAEGNYYAPPAECYSRYESWEEFARTTKDDTWEEIFIDKTGGNALYDFDDDLNMLWRWDWVHQEAEPEFEIEESHTLNLYFMMQRKARCASAHVTVQPKDEPAIREWLSQKASYVAKVWSPFLSDKEATNE